MGGCITRLFPSWQYSVIRTQRKRQRMSELVESRLEDLSKAEEDLKQQEAAYEEQLRALQLAKTILTTKVKGERRKPTRSELRDTKRSEYRMAVLTENLQRCEREFDLLMEKRVHAEKKRPRKGHDPVLSDEAFIKFEKEFRQYTPKSDVSQEEQDRALHDIAMDMEEAKNVSATPSPGRDKLQKAMRTSVITDAEIYAMFALDEEIVVDGDGGGGAVEIIETTEPSEVLLA